MPPKTCGRQLTRRCTASTKPFLEQFLHWLARALHGDLGTSIATNRPVMSEVSTAVINSIRWLTVATLIGFFTFGCLFGFVAGSLARLRRPTAPPRSLSVLGVSIPHYWLGMVLVIVFSVLLGWLPATGAGPGRLGDWAWDWEHFQYMLLPRRSPCR